MTVYFTQYNSNLIGGLTLASDGECLVGCWFDNDRYFGYGAGFELSDDALSADATVHTGTANNFERDDNLQVLVEATDWLNRYFAGEQPSSRALPLGGKITKFQQLVREAMLSIAYGKTTTYGAIAKELECATGKRQSPRAVGGAVGHNPLCVIVPCHRVVGANGNLTGFGGGIETKIKLLKFENAMQPNFVVPKNGTAICGKANAAKQFFGESFNKFSC